MRVIFGGYRHAIGEVAPSIQQTPMLNDAAQVYAMLHRWTLNGHLIAPQGTSNPATPLNAMAAALKAAYATGRKDLYLTLPDGSTPTTHRIISARSLGGTRVVEGPTFGDLTRAAGVTHLPYTIVVEAEVPVAGAAAMLLSFEETITWDTMPIYGHSPTLTGRAVKQKLRNFPVYRATQTGSAVGYLDRPNIRAIAPPIWPAAEIKYTPGIRSPKRRGLADYWEFPVTWAYEFESNQELITANTNIWR